MPFSKPTRKRVTQAEVGVAAELMIAALLGEVDDFDLDQDRASSLEQEIANLRDIESLASAVKKSIKQRRRALAKTRNPLVAPLYRLPPEILVQMVDKSLGSDVTWLDARPETTLRRLTQLRTVSRCFVDAIDAYGHLWSNLFSTWKESGLGLAVRMSRQAPLTLVVRGPGPPVLQSPAFVSGVPARLTRLSLQHYSYKSSSFLDLTFRNLEYLRLAYVDGLRVAGAVHQMEWRLKKLVIEQTGVVWDSKLFYGLKELQIHMKGMPPALSPTNLQLYEILQRCPQIEKFETCIHFSLLVVLPEVPPDVLNLPNLRTLLLCMPPNANEQLTYRIRAPHCRNLRITASMNFLSTPTQFLDSIVLALASIGELRCTVMEQQMDNGILAILSTGNHVVLRVPLGEAPRAIRILSNILKDAKVTLLLVTSQEGTFAALNLLSRTVPLSDPPVWPLPGLRSLHIKRSDVPLDDLVQFVQLRSAASRQVEGERHKPVPLEHLTIENPEEGGKLVEVLGAELLAVVD